ARPLDLVERRVGMPEQVVLEGGGNGVHGTIDIQEAIASALVSGTAFGALQGLVHAVDGKDRYTRLHSEAVTDAA
ncbi:hypothetical protein LK516_22500, partial [Parabacteroides distasonis]|uniref:hypothetical protein n=1 Tax=Parabacteroides distasonis TaxID=823 RepID=UPI001D12F7E1